MGLRRRTYGPAIPREDPAPTAVPQARDLEKNQILHWKAQGLNGTTFSQYAIVRNTTGDAVQIAYVFPTDGTTKCYDEGGSNKGDKDNVLLRYSSELFPDAHAVSRRGCYAIADNDNPITITQMFLDAHHVDDMDGVMIDERDARDLDDHLWRDEKQDERPVTLMGAVTAASEAVTPPSYEPAARPVRQLPSYAQTCHVQTPSDDYEFGS